MDAKMGRRFDGRMGGEMKDVNGWMERCERRNGWTVGWRNDYRVI